MKRLVIVAGLCLSLLAPPRAFAQADTAPAAAVPLPVGPVPVIDAPPTPIYAEADYLLWWLRPATVSLPLVASPAGTLFGHQRLDAGGFSGLRLRLGLAPTASGEPGVEVGGLTLPRSHDLNTFSGPALLLPFLDTSRAPPREGGLPVAGTVSVASQTEVYGLHLVAANRVYCDGAFELDVLAGGRSFFVSDTLSLTADSASGADRFRTFDRFLTRNYFFAAQGGARAGWAYERFEARARFDVALGVVANSLRVSGQTVRPASAVAARPGPAVVNGGVFSLGSLGVSREARVAVLPELSLDVGVRLNDAVCLRLGYNFLYFSDVRRAGDQVPRGVNARALPVAGGDFNNPPAAAPIFRRTDLTIHGLNVGVELRF